jgi:hypothetical protein
MRPLQTLVAATVVGSVLVAAEAAAQTDLRYAPFRWSPVPAREAVPAGYNVVTRPSVGDPSTSPPTDPRLSPTRPTGRGRDSAPLYAPFRWAPVPAVPGSEPGR